MRTLALVAVLLASAIGWGTGLAFDTSLRYEFTNCSSGGSASQTISAGKNYYVRITDEDVWMCLSSTCASGGERIPVGTSFIWTVGNANQLVSCNSAGSTGDLIITHVFTP